MKITKAKDLLKNSEVAVVFFTHGQLFHYDRNGNGQTGNWVTDPDLLDGSQNPVCYVAG